MAQFYSLREAAEILRMNPEKLKEMAKTSKLRAFQDRGNVHFRKEEIDEMARSLGLGSETDLPLDAPAPKSAAKPAASGKSPPPSASKSPPPSGKAPAPGPRRTMHAPSDSDLSLVGDEHDVVPIGEDPPSSRGKSPSSKVRPGSGGKKSGGMPSPAPSPAPTHPGHDSDVRLVTDSSDMDFHLDADDHGNVAKDKDKPGGSKAPSDSKKKHSKAADKPDSGVRIVPLDKASDSDVKIIQDDRGEHDVALDKLKSKTPSDSDVRLELTDQPGGKRGQDAFVTEDIEMDLEALKAEEAKVKRRKPSKSSPEVQLPTTSPFELAEEGAGAATKAPKSAKKKPKKDEDSDSSSDFELTPADAGDHSPIELGSDELPIPLAKDDDSDAQVVLGDKGDKSGHDSGINLRDPKDSGISLEEGGSEEIEFELSHDATATPKPAPSTPKPAKGGHDSSGEFELTMDDSPVGEEGTSSEFELSLDPSAAGEEDSDSEFELSLDPGAAAEGTSSSDLEEASSSVDSDSEFELSVDGSGDGASQEAGLTEGEKDIFETDFEVPALDDESGSEAVALDESDSDLEDSDFELDLSDEDLASEEDSGSQVVALDEGGDSSEEVDDSEAKPVSRKPRKKTGDETEDFDEPLIDLDDMETEEAEAEAEPVGAAPARSAPWGVLPACFLVPSFLVMIFVVFMSFEMMSTMWGYRTGGLGARLIVDPVARNVFGEKDVP